MLKAASATGGINDAVVLHIGKIANAAQQAVGDAGCASAAFGDFHRAFFTHVELQ